MKPYQTVTIEDCGELMVPIPENLFVLDPLHPYAKLGAPYGDRSPYFLRQGVLDALVIAHYTLQTEKSGWKIQVFDAYRPIAVQQFMVDYAFAELVRERGLQLSALEDSQRQDLWQEVYQFWAAPNSDPALPPPHSTGAAVDVTLVDNQGQPVNMGSAIDEISPRSYPDYFAPSSDPQGQAFHANRLLLKQIMLAAGFVQHPNEWWHFSLGDQMWAWQQQFQSQGTVHARYGGV